MANATINGNINATNTGTTVSTVQPNGVFHTKGQGFIMSVFKLEVDKEGNLSAIEWEWK